MKIKWNKKFGKTTFDGKHIWTNLGRLTMSKDNLMKKIEKASKIVTAGSQFNHSKKAKAAPAPTEDNKRQRFDGSNEPPKDPKGGDCRCISPDGIVKRDGKKRFGF